MKSPSRLVAATLLAFLAASIANVLWELRVVPDQVFEERIAAIRADDRLVTLTASTRSTPRDRFLAATALLDLAGGGTLRIPDAGSVDDEAIGLLARMTIRIDDYPPDLSADQADALERKATFSGSGLIGPPGSDVVEFWIVTRQDHPTDRSLTLMYHDEASYFVSDSILQDITS